MRNASAIAIALAVGLCVATSAQDKKPDPPPPGRGAVSIVNDDPFPSTYKPYPSRPVVIRNVNILTAAGPLIRNGAILLRDGKVAQVGAAVDAPADAQVIDGAGKYVTPGIIDDHSHLGVYAAPGGDALSDGNEATSPSTPQVWAEHSVWPQDPQFPAQPRRRRDDAAGAAGIREPDRRTQRRAQGRAVADRAGHEVSRRQIRPEDGLRRESEARLRAARAVDADGQRRRLSRGVDSGREVPAQVGRLEQGEEGRRAGSRSGAWRRWPKCCAATSWSTTTATAPTRWRR